ncbi:NDP-sugar synthase [Candidatus Aenigmatarchaeota archaeon]
MKCLILGAGVGRRLRPLTYYINKIMLPLSDGRPLAEHIVDRLSDFNINEIIFGLSELSHETQVVDFFKENKNIKFDIAEKPLGTSGQILHAKEMLDDDFLVWYGDTLTDVPLDTMIKKHSGNIATLCGVKGVPVEFGVWDFDEDKIKFIEKPRMPGYVNCPVFLLNKEVFSFLKEGEDFFNDTIPKLMKENKKIHVYKHEGYYFDVGRLSDYENIRENGIQFKK